MCRPDFCTRSVIHPTSTRTSRLPWSRSDHLFCLPVTAWKTPGTIPDISPICLPPCLFYSSLVPWWWHYAKSELEKATTKSFYALLWPGQCIFSQWWDWVAKGNSLKVLLERHWGVQMTIDGDRTAGCCICSLTDRQQLHYCTAAVMGWVEKEHGEKQETWGRRREFATRLLQKHVSIWLLSVLASLVASPDILCLSFQYGFCKAIPSAFLIYISVPQGKEEIICKNLSIPIAFLCSATLQSKAWIQENFSLSNPKARLWIVDSPQGAELVSDNFFEAGTSLSGFYCMSHVANVL